MFYSFLSQLGLIILFGMLVSQVILTVTIYGMGFMMGFLLDGSMGLFQLLHQPLIFVQLMMNRLMLPIGLLSVIILAYYLGHLLKTPALIQMLFVHHFYQFLNMMVVFELLLISPIPDGVLVSMIAFMRVLRPLNIFHLPKFVNSFMTWVMMRDYGWSMLRMHIIVCPFNQNIGDIWV